MALAPISSSNIATFQRPRQAALPEVHQHNQRNDQSSVSEISDNIQTIKDSSLLYQLISRLLLSPEQDKQLSDSLELNSVTEPAKNSELQSINSLAALTNLSGISASDSFQFDLSIEVVVIRIESQSLTVTDQFGTFTETTTVVEALSLSLNVSISGQFGEVEESDPLIIDVEGDGFSTTGVEQGALFDINADGIIDQVSVTSKDDAFLALDINGNGTIDNGSELFGDQAGFSNGFANLASYDDNNDGLIDANDTIFNSLLMMRLIDNKQFITALSEANINAINLNYTETVAQSSQGDRIVQMSDYQNSNGQKGVIADLMLKYKSGIIS